MRRYLNRRKLVYILTALLLGAALLPAARSVFPQAHASTAPGVDPQTFSATLSEGNSTPVAKTVHTPTIPPRPDIVFLSDTTGSMQGVINSVQANIASVANQILAAQPQAQFAVAQYKDQFNCSSDPFAYHLDQALTTNLGAVQSAVNTWSANGGCDEPESDLFALDQIATSSALGFRSDSTRVIVWFGDAPSHDETHPNSPVTLAQTIADLQAAKIEVIAVPFNHGGSGLDGFGQASQVTADTSGVLLPSQSSDNAVANAILTGLHNLPVTVSPQLGVCDPNLAVTFDAPSKMVTSGDDAGFTETIAVAPGAPFGTTLHCHVDFLLNGIPAGPAFGEDNSITVPAHATTLTYTGDKTQDYHDQATLRAHLIDAVTGLPVAGKTVTLSMGSQSCSPSPTTNSKGDASCSITVNQPKGTYPVSASFAGDSQYLPSNDNSRFTVTPEEVTVTSTPTLIVAAAGQPLTLVSTLLEDGTTATNPAEQVTMTLGTGSNAVNCTATTDTSGTASCQVTPTTALLGPQPVTDSFGGDGYYQPAANTQQALVFAFLKQGAFVLGNTTTANALASSPAPTVNWWGAQWARNNVLSGGAAPDAMKGFAGSPSSTPPACGGTYTTGPGNSTPPPAASSIPSYMGVIVSSQVTKSGSTISGDIPEIVVVKTDPGYSNDPGHRGSGRVLAVYCGGQ